MKKLLIVAVTIGFVTLTSCKKCHECHYEVVDAAGAETEVELGEHCGDDLKDLEANGYKLSDGSVAEVHCHAH